MARFDTGHGNLEDVRGDLPAVEQWFLRLHYRRLPHVHLLVADGVQYGARGFVGLQRKVCDVRHPKSAGVAAGAGATLVELLPKKSASGKSAALFLGFCLVQLKTARTKVVDISTTTCFVAATAVATVLDDFFSTAISTFLLMFSSINLRLSFLSFVVSR